MFGWFKKKKLQLKLLNNENPYTHEIKTSDDVTSVGGLVQIGDQTYILIQEQDESLWLLPLYEFVTSKTMYKLGEAGTQKPSKATLRQFGYSAYGGLELVSSEPT